ncbi:DEAD/DEAH box helicase [Treponema primitia]|uniref:DEAD/DEAH box helicase n=1 Tax=Treponema primitia TaxID=88058 RepID=UPI0002F25A30|nr:DEAD/DEAH box helicase [Treponema primitia]
MPSVGDYVYDKANKSRVQIVAVNNLWNYTSYTVFNSVTNNVYKILESDITTDVVENDSNENYLRYIALLTKIKHEIANGVITKLSNNVIPLPHQLYVLNRAISSNKVRYILADEVGLGKTIEAGLILKELKARGLVKRTLVVCPTGLVTQWNMELQDKFSEIFNIIRPEDYNTIRRITNVKEVYSQFNQVISPMDSIKPLTQRAGWTEEQITQYNEERIYSIINSGWDLIIIDEAHRVAGSSGEVARHKLGQLLAAASPYLLLLTATPHNGKTDSFLRLVRLIDEKAFPNARAVIKEQVAPYVIRTEKREAIDNIGKKLFKKRITITISLHWDERHTMQKELYTLVSEYVSKNYNKAARNRSKNMWYIMLLIMMQRLVTSSTRAIKESLEKRITILKEDYELYRDLLEEIPDDVESLMEASLKATSLDIESEIHELGRVLSVAKQAEYQYLDVKIDKLYEIIDTIFSQDKKRKILIFTEFIVTQNYLNEMLQKRGYIISLLNGNMNIEDRNIVLQNFKDNACILISTDAGGEGINLQFSNFIINYGPPMESNEN